MQSRKAFDFWKKCGWNVKTETEENERGSRLPVSCSSDFAPVENPPQQAPLPGKAPLPSEASDVEFSTASLTTGKDLHFPIYDKSGLLLVAQGAVVTSRFKELLVLRGMQKVMVSKTDAKAMLAGVRGPAIDKRAMEIDSDVVKLLDQMIESGQFFSEDVGEKFKNRLQVHDCKAFDEDLRNELVAKHSQTCSLLDEMIKAAAHGDQLNGGDIATVVSEYLSHLTLDSDCAHSVMAHAREFASIAQHSLQSALLGMALAIEMGMDENMVRLVGMCGLLHDWGMTYVPEQIRNAKRVLTRIEFLEVTKHPIYTANMLERLWGLPPQVAMICYQIHENPNGGGYPRGKQKSSIHPCAGILKVADVYIALTSPRPFRLPLRPSAAIQCLVYQASRKIVDNGPARALIKVLSQFPIGSLVQLSDGSKAQVLRRNGDNYHMPIVQVFEKADGTPADPRDESCIIDPSKSEVKIVRVLPTPGRKELDLNFDVLVLKRS